MPPEAGLLIDRTHRMHPRLCRFTSEVFYDGKLSWVDGLDLQEIMGEAPLSGAGLLVILLFLRGGIAEALMRIRNVLLRFVAKRRGIVVPSRASASLAPI